MSDTSNDADMIDSRDVIARIEELEAMAVDANWSTDAEESVMRDLDDDEETELTSLHELAEEGARVAEDWQNGATLIRESYFQEYAEDYAREVFGIREEDMLRWPFCHIDWDEAAEELKTDYTEVDYDGVTYYVR